MSELLSRNGQLWLQERAEAVASNKGEIEGLFDKRSSAEQAFLERYMAAAEAFEKQLEDLRCADAEDYNLLKVRCITGLYSDFSCCRLQSECSGPLPVSVSLQRECLYDQCPYIKNVL